MAVAKEVKTLTIKSLLDATLIYNGIEIMAGEIVELDYDSAKYLVDKGYCEEVKKRKVGE